MADWEIENKKDPKTGLTAGADWEIINVGKAPNDGTGDPIRDAMVKVNKNFSNLFSDQRTTNTDAPYIWTNTHTFKANVDIYPSAISNVQFTTSEADEGAMKVRFNTRSVYFGGGNESNEGGELVLGYKGDTLEKPLGNWTIDVFGYSDSKVTYKNALRIYHYDKQNDPHPFLHVDPVEGGGYTNVANCVFNLADIPMNGIPFGVTFAKDMGPWDNNVQNIGSSVNRWATLFVTKIYDVVNSPGSPGQILSSSSEGLKWIDMGPLTKLFKGVNQSFVGDGTTKTFNIAGGYTPGELNIFLNGVRLTPGKEVDASSGTSIVFVDAPINGIPIDVVGALSTNTTVDTSKAYDWTANQAFRSNVTMKAIIANGSIGQNGQVLTSNGSGIYWAAGGGGGGSVNTDAQYTWTNTQTFNANVNYAVDNWLKFRTLTNSNVEISSQSDGNFTIYAGDKSKGDAQVLSVNTANNSQRLRIFRDLELNAGIALGYNGSKGTNGQVLSSTGTGLAWADIGAGGVNTSAEYTWSNTHTHLNTVTFEKDADLIFKTNTGNTVVFTQQSDDNFVMYRPTRAGGSEAVWGVFSNPDPANGALSAFAIVTNAMFYSGIIDTYNGTTGNPGQVLSSTGTGLKWIDGGTPGSVNTSAPYVWSNTHKFTNTVTYEGNSYISFTSKTAVGNVDITHQDDDGNFVIYRSNISGGKDPVLSFFSNPNATPWSSWFRSLAPFQPQGGIIDGDVPGGSTGTNGQVLSSTGTGVKWITVGSGGVNTAAQYTWTNDHAFNQKLTINFSNNASNVFFGNVLANVYNFSTKTYENKQRLSVYINSADFGVYQSNTSPQAEGGEITLGFKGQNPSYDATNPTTKVGAWSIDVFGATDADTGDKYPDSLRFVHYTSNVSNLHMPMQILPSNTAFGVGFAKTIIGIDYQISEKQADLNVLNPVNFTGNVGPVKDQMVWVGTAKTPFKTFTTNGSVVYIDPATPELLAASLDMQTDWNFVIRSTYSNNFARAVAHHWTFANNSANADFEAAGRGKSGNGFFIDAPLVIKSGIVPYGSGNTGVAGQILSSTGTGVAWINPTSAGVNTAAQYTWTNTHTFNADVVHAVDKNITLKTTSGGNVSFVSQNDGVFAFYTPNGAVWSVPTANTSSFRMLRDVEFNAGIVAGFQGSKGTAGQILSSTGTGIQWINPTSAGVNTAAQYTWTNTHTFSTNNGGKVQIIETTGKSNTSQKGTALIISNGNFVVTGPGLTSNCEGGEIAFGYSNKVFDPAAVDASNTWTIDVFGYAATNGSFIGPQSLRFVNYDAGSNVHITMELIPESTGNFGNPGKIVFNNDSTLEANTPIPFGVNFNRDIGPFRNSGVINLGSAANKFGNAFFTNIIDGTNSKGTAGQILSSTGSGLAWIAAGGAGVNTSAQYTWTNNHTFSANVTHAVDKNVIFKTPSGGDVSLTSQNDGIFALYTPNGAVLAVPTANTGSFRMLRDVEFNAGIVAGYNGSKGTAGQVLSSTGTGIQWINPGGLSTGNKGPITVNSDTNWSLNAGVVTDTNLAGSISASKLAGGITQDKLSFNTTQVVIPNFKVGGAPTTSYNFDCSAGATLSGGVAVYAPTWSGSGNTAVIVFGTQTGTQLGQIAFDSSVSPSYFGWNSSGVGYLAKSILSTGVLNVRGAVNQSAPMLTEVQATRVKSSELLEKVCQLESFTHIPKGSESNNHIYDFDPLVTENLFPGLVSETDMSEKQDGSQITKGIAYGNMTVVLAEAMKALNDKVTALTEENKQLRSDLDSLLNKGVATKSRKKI